VVFVSLMMIEVNVVIFVTKPSFQRFQTHTHTHTHTQCVRSLYTLWTIVKSSDPSLSLLQCVYSFIHEKSKIAKRGGGGTIRLCWFLSSLHLTQEFFFFRYVV